MIKILIPRFKYWKSAPAGETSYPYLQDDADGVISIPEAYGVLKNVTPICIDMTLGKYKVSRRAIKAIDAVRDKDRTLAGTEYTATAGELAVGEFALVSAPVLMGSADYWFVVESDYAITGWNYLRYNYDKHTSYGINTPAYIIDGDAGLGNWTQLAIKYSIEFRLYGRTTIDGADSCLIDRFIYSVWDSRGELRNIAAYTRIAQKFTMPAGGPYHLSMIELHSAPARGTPIPTRITKVQIVSAMGPPLGAGEISVGAKSARLEDNDNDKAIWNLSQGETNDLRVDIQGLPNPDTTLMENVADVLKDIYVNIIGGSAAGINAADLVVLKAARTQDAALYMADEKEAQQHIEIFEAGHLFKFLPSLGGDFAVRCLTSGEPAGTPHLKKEHIRNFTMRRVWSNVFHIVKIKYYQDPTTGDWLMAEAKSDIANYIYNRQNSIEIETVLKDAADAVQLAKDYLGTDPVSTRKVNLQYPTRIAEFDVLAGYGFDLIPTMKVKLMLPRADYAGGSLNDVLFRILEVHKNPEDRLSHLVTLLDSLTY